MCTYPRPSRFPFLRYAIGLFGLWNLVFKVIVWHQYLTKVFRHHFCLSKIHCFSQSHNMVDQRIESQWSCHWSVCFTATRGFYAANCSSKARFSCQSLKSIKKSIMGRIESRSLLSCRMQFKNVPDFLPLQNIYSSPQSPRKNQTINDLQINRIFFIFSCQSRASSSLLVFLFILFS